jgi:PAS domain S-box-containing protein
MALLILLDYLIIPDQFYTFLIYRIISILLFTGLELLNRHKRSNIYQSGIAVMATVTASSMIELMILTTGGHESTYYVGMIIAYIFIIGLLPISLGLTVILACIIYAIYLFPILVAEPITNTKVFTNNNLFLLAIFLIGFMWRYVNQQLLLNKLSLEYDLSQEKRRLEVYSQQLEQLVQERTRELSISETWHRSIFDNATDGILVLDRNGVIMNVNQSACDITGLDRDALIGSNIDLIEGNGREEDHRERMIRILNAESLIYEIEHHKNNGSRVVIEVSSKAIDISGESYIQSFYRDITEKKSIQEQLIHSQKMESVGILAGGIAHNFNNILAAILGYADLLLEFSDLDAVSRQRVHNIEKSARKAGAMVSQMLRFARREAHEVLPLNLHDAINDAIKIFEGAAPKNIRLLLNLDASVPMLSGDPNQIEQIVMNLLVNASDAMPDGGVITISTRLLTIEADRSKIPFIILPGRYVVLSISDTGTGIPQESLKKIFDPFFTTKDKGKGTGLGLATVYGIVKDHKGYIDVQTEIEKGTTFYIYFPAIERTAKQAAKLQNLE